jgi:hypothetical protein
VLVCVGAASDGSYEGESWFCPGTVNKLTLRNLRLAGFGFDKARPSFEGMAIINYWWVWLMFEKTIRVPSIFQGSADEMLFAEELTTAQSQDCRIVLDFHSQPAVSSLILGQILFRLKDISSRVAFINVSNYLYDTLQTIMGPMVDDFLVGPIQDLDDADVLDEV